MDINLYKSFLEARLPKYIEILGKMVVINSFTRNPQGVISLGEWTANLFKPLGFEPEYIQSVNPEFGRHVFLRSFAKENSTKDQKTNPTIVFVSHLDTVFSQKEELEKDFHFRVENDRVYGPGTYDCKGGTVMAFMILEAIKNLAPELFASVDWLVALDASEETSSEDFGGIIVEKTPQSARACLVLEGGAQTRTVFHAWSAAKVMRSFIWKQAGVERTPATFTTRGQTRSSKWQIPSCRSLNSLIILSS